MTTFALRVEQLKDDLITQGDRVVDVTLRAVECYFDNDVKQAEAVIASDDVIDRVDVEIERASVPLLAMGETDEHQIRRVLTIVKLNNELERIADCAVNIAEVVRRSDGTEDFRPDTFRVMANSVVGMLRDTNSAFRSLDVELATRVLQFDDVVDQFKSEIMLNVEEQVAAGNLEIKAAFRLNTVTKSLERIADHCTNICEQLIYLATGRVVRHLPDGWTKPVLPE